MKKNILSNSLSRATPARRTRTPRSITGALLVASLLANAVLARSVRILYLDNADMRAYVDTIAGNFRYIKPHVKGENHGK